MAVTGQRAVDECGVHLQQAMIVEPKLLHNARTKLLNEDIVVHDQTMDDSD